MRFNSVFSVFSVVVMGVLLACSGDKLECGSGTYEVDGKCVPGDGSDGWGGSASSGSAAWIGSGPVTTLVHARSDRLAWRITHGDCESDLGDQLCKYTVFLTGEVGRNCSRCDDQTVNLSLRFTSDGQIQLDSVRLTEGSGMPVGVTFDDLGLPLTPEAPHAEDTVYLLSAEFLGPGGWSVAYAGWVLLSKEVSFMDAKGRDYSGCNTFIYTEPDASPGGWVVDEPVRVTVCSGEGIVQVSMEGDAYVRD